MGTVDHLIVSSADTTYIALMLTLITRRPVVDRSGLGGTFSFDLRFAPQDAKLGDLCGRWRRISGLDAA